jgi:hypothetical protein
MCDVYNIAMIKLTRSRNFLLEKARYEVGEKINLISSPDSEIVGGNGSY